jgi:hypothetical protein
MSDENNIPTITDATYVKRPINVRQPLAPVYIRVPLEYKPLMYDIAALPEKLSTLEKAWVLIKSAPQIIGLLFSILTISKQIKGGKMTQSMLDTIKGIIRAIFAILAGVGLTTLTPEQVESLVLIFTTAWGLIELVLGFFSNSKMVKKD